MASQDRQDRLRRRHGHPADPPLRPRVRGGREVRQPEDRDLPEHDRDDAGGLERPHAGRRAGAEPVRPRRGRHLRGGRRDRARRAPGRQGQGQAGDRRRLEPEPHPPRHDPDLDDQARRPRRVRGLQDRPRRHVEGRAARPRRRRGRRRLRARPVQPRAWSPRRWSGGWSRRERTSSPGRSRSPTTWRSSLGGGDAPRRLVARAGRAARHRAPRHREVVRRGPRQSRRVAPRRAGDDPRHRRRERRRQVDSDGHPLRVLTSPTAGRSSCAAGAVVMPQPGSRAGRRDRHGAPALHAGRALHRAGERRARGRGRLPARRRAWRAPAPSSRGWRASITWRWIPTRGSRTSAWASASASRSSRRCTAAPTS